MGAIKPWHLLLAGLCCLLPTTAIIAGGIWAIARRRNRQK